MQWYEKFKVGDKVKPKNPKWIHGDGKIVSIDENGWIQAVYDTSVCVICDDENCGMAIKTKWHRPSNIERVTIKGQQLLFNFMKG